MSLHCFSKGFIHLVDLEHQIVARVSDCLRWWFHAICLHFDFDERLERVSTLVPRELYCLILQQLVSNYIAKRVVFILDCDESKIDFVLLILDFRFYVHFIYLYKVRNCLEWPGKTPVWRAVAVLTRV